MQKSGGGSVYWTELIKRIKENVVHYAYDSARNNFFFNESDLPNLHICSSSLLAIKRYLNLKLKNRKEMFIFHSSLYRLCKNKKAINITTVHDFTYEYYRKDLKANLHKMQKKYAVMHSNGVICISENTKKDLLKYYPKFKGKIKVIHNGYATDTYFYKSSIKKTKNILFVGARTDYKRFDFTVGIVSELNDCNFIIIGGGNLTQSEEVLLNTKLTGRYEKKHYISDEELCELYNSAFFLCYPSEYEGFGIPVIEAQACGCPVVSQAKSSIPEIAGDTVVYIDSDNFNKSVENVRKLYDSEYYSEIQKKGLENVKRFSWDKSVSEVKSFYESHKRI
ncbi:glycosyltransferase family 4 protein [Treponema brennaborense]|uniref:glycosyltransferase family 4 protein n=1 Tax=Treponema brennaborense TaxID=81028 RepID=UPI00145CFE43|nr:glycosyltransferase family 1 protein [Treponema brennaborense]